MILRIAHLSTLVKYTVISGFEKCVKIQHLTRSLRKHLLLIQLLHQRLHHFIPMLTKVLIQRIGRTFGQHHNLNAPVARALRILESSSIWSAIALTCITLSSGIPASSSTRRAESARSPERFQLL